MLALSVANKLLVRDRASESGTIEAENVRVKNSTN